MKKLCASYIEKIQTICSMFVSQKYSFFLIFHKKTVCEIPKTMAPACPDVACDRPFGANHQRSRLHQCKSL